MGSQILELDSPTWADINSPLLRFRQNIFSQSGEDGVIAKILEVLPDINTFFVEFGAWDGLHLSNCARLARDFGWSGIFIEGDVEKFDALTSNYAQNPLIIPINKWVSLSAGATLDEIVSPTTQEVGILSIDIDGNDYHIWDSIKVLRPTLVIIEVNPSIPNDVKFVQEYSPEVNHGSSLLAMNALGVSKGYELICCTSANAFFVKREYFKLFNIPDNSVEKLFVPKCNGRIFHGFDGTIFTVGMERIIWKGIAVGAKDLQLLPPDQRKLT